MGVVAGRHDGCGGQRQLMACPWHMQAILNTTKEHLRTNLCRLAYQLRAWEVKVLKIKAVFYTLNKFSVDPSRRSLLAQCWCPKADLPVIRETLKVRHWVWRAQSCGHCGE